MENVSGSGDLGTLAGAPDECLVFDLQGRCVAANDSALTALGAPLEELVGRRAWELVTCLTASGFDHVLEAIRAEGPQSLLGHLRRRDGTLLATETRLWLGPHGAAQRVFALAREMRGCQGLIEERDQLAHLMETSSEFVLLFDGERRLTYANRAALAQLGFERAEDALGLGLSELVMPGQRAMIDEVIAPRLAIGPWEGELDLRSWRDQQASTPCWAHVFPVRHSRTKRRVGIACTARDISARRAAEMRRTRLLRLAEVSRNVALHLLCEDDLNQAVFEILEGVGGILSVARAYLHRFREDGQWLLRTHEWSPDRGPEHQKGGPSDVGLNYRWASEVLARGEVLRIEDAVPLEDTTGGRGLLDPGERALLLLPVRIHGRLESVFGFVHDRSRPWEDDEVAAVQLIVDSFAHGIERQIAERERNAALRELEAAVEREKVASRYKSEFLASMSHELRTPMNAIRGYAELLGRSNPARALQEQWIRNLRRSTEYLLGLIHDVLDLSKIEAGHMRPELESTALAEVLVSVKELLAPSAREKGLSFALELVGELPETFETDPVRLKQILVNLTANAIKFTDRGSVVLRVRRKGTAGEGFTLEVTVCDTGIGIPAEEVGKLFLPFSQVHQRAGGTGLGLQISRSLARLLGGDITVDSQPRKGSVFTLEIPLDGAHGCLRELPDRESGADSSSWSTPAALQGKRILVVDDSRENREVMRFLLEEAGAECQNANNGQLGVECALAAEKSGAPFDAVLMDMNMPVMNGFQATRALVEAGATSPVIALTAMALAGDEERCREAGCVAHVGKPIVPSLFFETLAKNLRTASSAAHAPMVADEPEPAGAVFSLTRHPRFRGLVERYTASFPELTLRLRYLERQGELEEVRTLVHRLRGTAASYGFPGLSQAAGRCEDSIRSGATRAEILRNLDDLLGGLTSAAAG